MAELKSVDTIETEQFEQRWKDNHEDDEWYQPRDAEVAGFNEFKDKSKAAILSAGVKLLKTHHDQEKRIVCLVVALRAKHKATGKDIPDWGGRSGPYKADVMKMYREAGIPKSSADGLMGALSYHIQNLIVKVAPHAELKELGIDTVSRKERQKETARKRAQALKDAEKAAAEAEKEAEAVKAPPPPKTLNQAVKAATKAITTYQKAARGTEHPSKLFATSLISMATEVRDSVKKQPPTSKELDELDKLLQKTVDILTEINHMIAAQIGKQIEDMTEEQAPLEKTA